MSWKQKQGSHRPHGLLMAFTIGIMLGGAFGAWTAFGPGVERGLFTADDPAELGSPAMQEPEIQRFNQLIDCSFLTSERRSIQRPR
jgi:hypothetical protein